MILKTRKAFPFSELVMAMAILNFRQNFKRRIIQNTRKRFQLWSSYIIVLENSFLKTLVITARMTLIEKAKAVHSLCKILDQQEAYRMNPLKWDHMITTFRAAEPCPHISSHGSLFTIKTTAIWLIVKVNPITRNASIPRIVNFQKGYTICICKNLSVLYRFWNN